MKYELLTTTEDGVKIYARIDDDGVCRVTCTEDNPECQESLKPKSKTKPIIDEPATQSE